MLRKIFPLALILAGAGAGVGAGVALRPDPAATPAGEAVAEPCTPATGTALTAATEGEGAVPLYDYVKMNNQFVVPVVEAGSVAALVILSLSLEVPTGGGENVYALEPKLRDAFLQVLFDHANAGGFAGAFTGNQNMQALRGALLESATALLGEGVRDVLIVDIVRQDG